jgi:hypothetical protein
MLWLADGVCRLHKTKVEGLDHGWMARVSQPISHNEIKPPKATIIRVTKAQD